MGYWYVINLDLALLALRMRFNWGRKRAGEQLGFGRTTITRWELTDGPVRVHGLMLKTFLQAYKELMGNSPKDEVIAITNKEEAEEEYELLRTSKIRKRKEKLVKQAAKVAKESWPTANYQ